MVGFLELDWEPVKGRAEGYPYEVSVDGEVRRVDPDSGEVVRHLEPYPGGPDGEYERVDLRAPGRKRLQVYVHQLVAWAHVPGDPTGKIVDHRDGDPTNNRADNLRYLDAQENMRRGR